MTNKDALEFAKRERAAHKCKVADGLTFYQKVVDYYDIVVEALEKMEQRCENCDHRRNRDFDMYWCNERMMWVDDDMRCSDWSDEE